MERTFSVQIGDRGSVPVARDIQACVRESNVSVYIEKDGRRVSANSMIGILSLGIVNGDTIKVSCYDGDEYASGVCLDKIGKVVCV